MSAGPAVLALVAMAGMVTLAACESTQDKAKKLQKSGSKAFTAKGLRVTKLSKDVKVRGTAIFSDENGTAVAVRLQNTSDKTLRRVPIAIDVRNGKGKSVFKNDFPGLDPALVGISVLRPGEKVTWVNDQVLATGKPAKVKVKVGVAGEGPGRLPRIEVTPPKLEGDPVSGLSVVGRARNRSDTLQRQLTLYAVAQKGGRIVAAGRGGIEKLRPGDKGAGYQIFFIGNPKGAKVELAAPPTTFE
jgi:hypothetical protein